IILHGFDLRRRNIYKNVSLAGGTGVGGDPVEIYPQLAKTGRYRNTEGRGRACVYDARRSQSLRRLEGLDRPLEEVAEIVRVARTLAQISGQVQSFAEQSDGAMRHSDLQLYLRNSFPPAILDNSGVPFDRGLHRLDVVWRDRRVAAGWVCFPILNEAAVVALRVGRYRVGEWAPARA